MVGRAGRAARRTGIGNGPDDAGTVADSQVVVDGIRKEFVRRTGERVIAVDDVSLSVESGNFTVLLGPSGCGKSTLLRCIAGLERPTRGYICLGGTVVSSSDSGLHVPSEAREIGMMFQTYAVWPHMTVNQNVGYPLKVRRRPRDEIRERVGEIVRMMGLDGLGDEYPGQLSGGQQQRVSLARSLILNPAVMLFDEPLSNVDARVRRKLRTELVAMQRDFSFAGLYVTHDQEEAMHIADTVVLMNEGSLDQVGSPSHVYEYPDSRYAASFLGEVNELPGSIVGLGDPLEASGAEVETLLGVLRGIRTVEDVSVGDDVIVAVRPHQIAINSLAGSSNLESSPQGPGVGTLIRVVELGSQAECLVDVGGHHLTVWVQRGQFPASIAGTGGALEVPVRLTVPMSAGTAFKSQSSV